MPYRGSYIWKMRQKVGDECLINTGASTICINDQDEILMVRHRTTNAWTIPGGGAEIGQTWAEVAARELFEETAFIVSPTDLVPFASVSGKGYTVAYPDGKINGFLMVFIAQKFQPSNAPIDSEEISEIKWFTLEEAAKLKVSLAVGQVLSAFQIYLTTGEFQQIVIA